MTLRARPDLRVVNLRGNVETRLRKVSEGIVDAALLAAAGLARLGLSGRARSLIEPDDWLPAVGQGTIAITARADDRRVLDLLAAIDDRDTSIALAAERAFLRHLGGSCRTPIGGLARVAGGRVDFRGIIIKPDGSEAHEARREGPTAEAARIGGEAGQELAERGGPDFFTGG